MRQTFIPKLVAWETADQKEKDNIGLVFGSQNKNKNLRIGFQNVRFIW